MNKCMIPNRYGRIDRKDRTDRTDRTEQNRTKYKPVDQNRIEYNKNTTRIEQNRIRI